MCNWNLYLGAPGDAVVREVATAPCVKDVEPRVGWMEGGGVKLTRPDGQLLRP